ncbi:hypothetical protein FOA52_000627 [Chlamydomonas sp. UWO 241]|nr:hypothetical protein FOA52_000627 [Chlamydomonas sp. UWO 241]
MDCSRQYRFPWDLDAGFGQSNGLGGVPSDTYNVLGGEQWNSPLYCDSEHPQDLEQQTPWGVVTVKFTDQPAAGAPAAGIPDGAWGRRALRQAKTLVHPTPRAVALGLVLSCISDNICLTQMLPGLLAANAAEGVLPTGVALALLDFRKAYDTIDRGCLLAVMEAVGVGDGVLAWTRTILTHTYASAEVNGFISEPRRYAAGVRQGCPAAPALFLFLGHALACFLRTCPAVGVEVVPGCRVTCPQYADDCMPLLRSCAPAAVAALVEAMAVFGRATGLVLNLGKCGILPLGSAGEGLLAGAEVAGLRVLDAGVSLGVPVSAGLPPPEAVTGVCRERLAAAYTKLARFPMGWDNPDFNNSTGASIAGVPGTYNHLTDAILDVEASREMYMRRLRTLVDDLFVSGVVAKMAEKMHASIKALAEDDAVLWASGIRVDLGYQQIATEFIPTRIEQLTVYQQIVTEFIPTRIEQLTKMYGPGGDYPLLPDSQPADAKLTLGKLSLDPSPNGISTLQLTNPQTYAVDVSGWNLTGGVTFVFAPGTVVPAGASLLVSTRLQPSQPLPPGTTSPPSLNVSPLSLAGWVASGGAAPDGSAGVSVTLARADGVVVEKADVLSVQSTGG